MKRILTVLGVLALTASYAEARPKFSAQILYGLNGTAEAEAGGISVDDDIDSSIGAMGTVEWQLNRKSPFRLGLRVGYNSMTTSEGGADNDFTALDGGVWARYILVPGRFVVYGAGSLGVSALTSDPEGTSGSSEGTGINIHIGGGASYPVAKGMRLTGGIYFSRHSGELEGDGGATVDVVTQQVQLAVGVAF